MFDYKDDVLSFNNCVGRIYPIEAEIHYIYIESPLLKNKIGYTLFTTHLYFNSTLYYPTLDKTLAMQLSLHLL
jgi:hypothetical protein